MYHGGRQLKEPAFRGDDISCNGQEHFEKDVPPSKCSGRFKPAVSLAPDNSDLIGSPYVRQQPMMGREQTTHGGRRDPSTGTQPIMLQPAENLRLRVLHVRLLCSGRRYSRLMDSLPTGFPPLGMPALATTERVQPK